MKATLICIVFVSVVVSVAIAQNGCLEAVGNKPHGVWYLDGHCNKCYCNDGRVHCLADGGCTPPKSVTLKHASVSKDCLEVDGMKAHGSWFMDTNCNKCFCNDGVATCLADGGCTPPKSAEPQPYY